MLEMYSKTPRFHKFSRGGGVVCPWTALETGVENRNIFTFFKAFATDLKPY